MRPIKTAKRLVDWEEHKKLRRHIGQMLRSTLPRKPMALDDPGAPDMTNWPEVEKHWGFTERDRPRLIRAYKLHRWIAFIPLLLMGLVVWDQVFIFGFPTLNSLLISFLLLALSWIIFVSSSWRLWMLKNRKFQPLIVWIGVKNDEKYL
ncbi:hypothetical protein GO013_00080 [Pseudodesulfovibrio sp. JC047]|uniref:hypothetical protein n=1 Tax=Pseudodesulfovibrio sp. JC047 TaxID=2683199 RepID=UPI0013D07009|nr:hypothetical protein [Pseudodesulfovibrio sp. JC047]NDV17815.1 hypothetical protein [Pseudodesulfovibrio sp. JC047]